MKQVLVLAGIVFATTLLLALGTQYVGDTGQSRAWFFGYPVVAYAQSGATGIIALGQSNARGVLVIAQMGFGLVAFTQIGLGLVFSVSQLTFGLVAVTQGGIGVFGFLGQIGAGVHALGQGVVAYAGAGGALAKKGGEYLRELDAELGEVLAFHRAARGPSRSMPR